MSITRSSITSGVSMLNRRRSSVWTTHSFLYPFYLDSLLLLQALYFFSYALWPPLAPLVHPSIAKAGVWGFLLLF